jgi:hypothetical protein
MYCALRPGLDQECTRDKSYKTIQDPTAMAVDTRTQGTYPQRTVGSLRYPECVSAPSQIVGPALTPTQSSLSHTLAGNHKSPQKTSRLQLTRVSHDQTLNPVLRPKTLDDGADSTNHPHHASRYRVQTLPGKSLTRELGCFYQGGGTKISAGA